MAVEINGGVANQPNVPTVEAGWGRNDGWFEVVVRDAPARIISSPNVTEETDQDRVTEIAEAGTIAEDYILNVDAQPRPNASETEPSVSITTNGGLEFDDNDPSILRSLEDGVSEVVTVETPQRTVNISLKGRIRDDGAPAVIFKEFVQGSLGRHCNNAIDPLTTPGPGAPWVVENRPMFLDYAQSLDSGNFQWDPESWAYSLRQRLTCVAVWNSNRKNKKAGTAITPRHIAMAAHFDYGVGTTVKFLTENNEVISRKVVGRRRHPNLSGLYPDITIALLDEDLPASIVPCKVLPLDHYDYMPTGPLEFRVLSLNQHRDAIPGALFEWSGDGDIFAVYKSSGIKLYDSGCPSFLVINGELACLSLWTTQISGTLLTPEITAMNQMIADLDAAAGISTGYTLQTVDLSGFTNYS